MIQFHFFLPTVRHRKFDDKSDKILELNFMALKSDASLVRGLRGNDYKTLDYIYQEYLPKITSMILQNEGSVEAARDVFQEALMILFNKLQQADFEIKNSFFNYFYGICKFIWLRRLKKNTRIEVTSTDKMSLLDTTDIEAAIIDLEKRSFYQEKFKLLTEECQTVLQYFFDGISLKEIAQLMGYSPDYAKRKKYKCKEKLASLIKNDKRFREY